VLLQGNATLIFEEEQQEISMEKGSYLFIPAHKKHKVTFTSKQPPCIWLAIYLNKE
jgi:cupin 2 domain-containing protein